jgi:hypothetical protein
LKFEEFGDDRSGPTVLAPSSYPTDETPKPVVIMDGDTTG